MRLFFYYVFHSAKNALKKLFKTWVLVFIVIMLAGGMLVGLTLGTFLDKVAPSDPDTPPSQQEEVVPTPEDQAEVKGVVELAAGGIILHDPNVSRRHAEVFFDRGAWHIRDLNSTNGTLVNDMDVAEAVLRDRDILTIGLTNLEFRAR